MKTNKAAAKRLKTTGSGKIKFKGAYGRHIMRTKNRKRVRKIKATHYVHSANLEMTQRLLPFG